MAWPYTLHNTRGWSGNKILPETKKKLLIFPKKIKTVVDSLFTATFSAAELNILVLNHATSYAILK
jgi:hypothetical protein